MTYFKEYRVEFMGCHVDFFDTREEAVAYVNSTADDKYPLTSFEILKGWD
jgi:hypothetical protein